MGRAQCQKAKELGNDGERRDETFAGLLLKLNGVLRPSTPIHGSLWLHL